VKRSELAISVLTVPLDALAIFGAFIVSYHVRVETDVLPVANVIPFDRYVKLSAAITVVWLIVFALMGLYRLQSTRRGLNEFARIIGAVSIGSLIVIALIFFGDIEFFSRFVILFGFAASLVFVALERAIVRIIQQGLFRYGVGVRRAVIVGTGRTAQALGRELTSANRGYVVLGFIDTSAGRKPNPKALGKLADLPHLLKQFRPDELIDAEPKLADKQKLELVNLAEDEHIEFRFSSNSVELATSRVDVAAVAGIPLMTIQPTPLDGWGRVAKRLFDIIGSVIALPFILILYPFIALAIKATSRGPVIFKQTRVGRGGKTFTSYKFRSMVADAEKRKKQLAKKNEASGPVFKMKHDPRVTGVGRFLRRTSLDELPQFFNVLKGDMSLVGPRPPLPAEVKQYTREQRRRLTIKPGITGPWQVSGRSNIGFDEWVRLDVYYIQNWSLLLDLTILLKTVGVVLGRKGAY
jgi:exopolysaccharide biosynthesis polyprenyl glycosylphosphotransferase